MSVERTIANFLRIAREDLAGARHLVSVGNRNGAYLAEQAAEKVIRAVLTSEGVHAGVSHDLREMVRLVPDANPIKPLLAATAVLGIYATSYRYPGTVRIPPAPTVSAIEGHFKNVQSALDAAAKGFGVDFAAVDAVATRPAPLR